MIIEANPIFARTINAVYLRRLEGVLVLSLIISNLHLNVHRVVLSLLLLISFTLLVLITFVFPIFSCELLRMLLWVQTLKNGRIIYRLSLCGDMHETWRQAVGTK